MKQWNFKVEKLRSETLKALINELNTPGSTLVVRNFSEKSYLYYTILTMTKPYKSQTLSYMIKLHC